MYKLKDWIRGLFDTRRKKIIAIVIVVLMFGSAGLAFAMYGGKQPAPVVDTQAKSTAKAESLQATSDKIQSQEVDMLEKNKSNLSELDGYIR